MTHHYHSCWLLSPVVGGYPFGRSTKAFAVDAISRLVYYTGDMYYSEINDKFIAAMTLDGQHQFLLITRKGSAIENIALDPIAG